MFFKKKKQPVMSLTNTEALTMYAVRYTELFEKHLFFITKFISSYIEHNAKAEEYSTMEYFKGYREQHELARQNLFLATVEIDEISNSCERLSGTGINPTVFDSSEEELKYQCQYFLDLLTKVKNNTCMDIEVPSFN